MIYGWFPQATISNAFSSDLRVVIPQQPLQPLGQSQESLGCFFVFYVGQVRMKGGLQFCVTQGGFRPCFLCHLKALLAGKAQSSLTHLRVDKNWFLLVAQQPAVLAISSANCAR
jgi:hypothetical protein